MSAPKRKSRGASSSSAFSWCNAMVPTTEFPRRAEFSSTEPSKSNRKNTIRGSSIKDGDSTLEGVGTLPRASRNAGNLHNCDVTITERLRHKSETGEKEEDQHAMNGSDQTDHPSDPSFGVDTSGSTPPLVLRLREADVAEVAWRLIRRRFHTSKETSPRQSHNVPLNRSSKDRRNRAGCDRSEEDPRGSTYRTGVQFPRAGGRKDKDEVRAATTMIVLNRSVQSGGGGFGGIDGLSSPLLAQISTNHNPKDTAQFLSCVSDHERRRRRTADAYMPQIPGRARELEGEGSKDDNAKLKSAVATAKEPRMESGGSSRLAVCEGPHDRVETSLVVDLHAYVGRVRAKQWREERNAEGLQVAAAMLGEDSGEWTMPGLVGDFQHEVARTIAARTSKRSHNCTPGPCEFELAPVLRFTCFHCWDPTIVKDEKRMKNGYIFS
ncbi:hypothetical protein BJ912DRAFT_936876 [Pholiota molesta]|nr:hypothetical protein BJ912DRAFT_936876 [Pholiota molesta]